MAEAEEDLIKAALRGFSRAIILWMVGKKPMSGYRITKEMRRLTGRSFTSGVVYPLLYELEEKEFLTSEWVQRGTRHIKYYSITEKGGKLLKRLREFFEMPVREVLEDLLEEKKAPKDSHESSNK